MKGTIRRRFGYLSFNDLDLYAPVDIDVIDDKGIAGEFYSMVRGIK